MTENVLIICGLSMEMEMAKEMGYIGKCKGCLYYETNCQGVRFCQIHGVLSKEKENCKDWVVDSR